MPLQNNAMDGLIPVSIGTSIVEPTMANRCWKLSGIVVNMGNLSSTSTKSFIYDTPFLVSQDYFKSFTVHIFLLNHFYLFLKFLQILFLPGK